MTRGPVKVSHHYVDETAGKVSKANSWLAQKVTAAVGTMWTAYLFLILTLVSLPAAIASGDKIIIVAWIAQTFLQLVLLPIIIVGQNVQAAAADARSAATFADAEAILAAIRQLLPKDPA
jgi:ABC-type microcin C transport system permease subunit YejE